MQICLYLIQNFIGVTGEKYARQEFTWIKSPEGKIINEYQKLEHRHINQREVGGGVACVLEAWEAMALGVLEVLEEVLRGK